MRCTKCGMTAEEHIEEYGKTLDVHRLAPGSLYTVEGCITICRACHGPQPRRKKGEPDHANGERNVLFLRIENDLAEAIEAFINAQVVPPPRQTLAVVALRQFLAKHNFWPPKEKPTA